MDTLDREVVQQARGMPTSDGAGVKLTRLIGQPALTDLDPFLLLDEFGTDQPGDYIAGFPAHPHRGFETVTYMLDGRMRHKDNHGHEGVLVPGAVQWMTAGRGIVHSEMPEQQAGRMRGFQLWLNLPAAAKMVDPAYQEFGPEQIPSVNPAPGVQVKLIAGQVGAVTGPVTQPATDPTYLDVELQPQTSFVHALPAGHAAFVYVFEGALSVGAGATARRLPQHTLAVLGTGAQVRLQSESATARAILVAGRPLHEPVVRQGPFVMNTQEQLRQAFQDYHNGRF
ncbi:MAG TPA: pirin family protein, partial [Steroidobacteraceae bacterium]